MFGISRDIFLNQGHRGFQGELACVLTALPIIDNNIIINHVDMDKIKVISKKRPT